MVQCMGYSDGGALASCPFNPRRGEVVLCQADLMLCKMCEDKRFPDFSRISNEKKKATKVTKQSGTGAPLYVTLPHCIHGCKYNGKDSKDMIRCCFCMAWFHHDCLELAKSETRGVWSCFDCRLMPKTIASMAKLIDGLYQAVGVVEKKIGALTDVNRNIERLLDLKQNECGNLKSTVTQLRAEILTLRPPSTCSVTQSTERTMDLLTGSSLIRDIDSDKLANTSVVCIPGAKISNIKDELSANASFYDNVTLVVGGNDCHQNPPRTAADIIDSYNDLLDVTCSKANTVTVSSVCPRLTSQATQDTIEAVNAGLLSLCTDKPNVVFVDNSPSFSLGDGTLNDGYFLPDGIHITRPAVNKLAQNLKLRIRDKAEGACRDRRHHGMQTHRHGIQTHKSRSYVQHDVVAASDRDDRHQAQVEPQRDDGWQLVQRSRRSRPRHDGNAYDQRGSAPSSSYGHGYGYRENRRCFNCSERGHLEKDCKYGQPLVCTNCNETGHKSKFCELYSY